MHKTNKNRIFHLRFVDNFEAVDPVLILYGTFEGFQVMLFVVKGHVHQSEVIDVQFQCCGGENSLTLLHIALVNKA